MARAEIPYSMGTVLPGESIVHVRPGWLIVLGLAAVTLLGGAVLMLRTRFRPEASGLHTSVLQAEKIP